MAQTADSKIRSKEGGFTSLELATQIKTDSLNTGQNFLTPLTIGNSTKRRQWTNKLDFLISTIGYAVDLSNVFRFPYLCYKNGGGAFLIPYFIMVIICAFPLFLMEIIIGQYFQQGCIGIWDITPLFKGIGWASCGLNFLVGIYYNVIIAWSAFYIFSSMSKDLPWAMCNQFWNTKQCIDVYKDPVNGTSVSEFFHRRMLHDHESLGLSDLGTIHWEISTCLLLTYVILYLCLFQGVKSLGKAAWITSILPYVVLSIMLVRGLTLENAWVGIKYFIKPDFSALQKIEVWADAASQIFFSMGIGFGVHIAYASYNDFKQPLYATCIVAMTVNSFTSLFSGFVVFAYLGYLSNGGDIQNFADENVGMVIMVYSQVLTRLPVPQLWSLLFFIMVFSLGIDSSFGALEALLTALRDNFSKYLSRIKHDREILTAIILIILYLISLPHACSGGMYWTQFLDQNLASGSLLFIGILQCVVVAWLFGVQNLSEAAREMFGKPASIFFCVILKYITPIILVFTIYSRLMDISVQEVKISGMTYKYPDWSIVLIWLMALQPLIITTIVAIWQIVHYRNQGCPRRILALLISPISEHDDIKADGDCPRFHMRHWFCIKK